MQPTQPASDAHLQLEGPQWLFAIDLYQRPGVANACLLLQDRLGADVTLLLFVLFVAETYRTRLDASDFEYLDSAIAAWRREVVWPLRSIRRRLKTGPDPAPSSATVDLREQIQAAEIHAEQIELAVLAQGLERRQPVIGAAPVEVVDLLDGLAYFFAARSADLREGTSAEVRAALNTIADALARRPL